MPSRQCLVVAIECGGTKCSVYFATRQGVVASAVLGSCNYTTLGLVKTVERIKEASEAALERLPDVLRPVECALPLAEPFFAGLILGGAGIDRQSDREAITPHLARLFSLDPKDKRSFIVGNDALLLSIPMMEREHDFGIAVVAGTGSVAYSFAKSGSNVPTPVRRAGGYGSLLGDEGSGFHIGKLAIKAALAEYDSQTPFSDLSKAIYAHFGCTDTPDSLLQQVYKEDSQLFPGQTVTSRVSSLCRLVFEARKEEQALGNTDSTAESIIRTGTASLAELVASLLEDEGRNAAKTMLVMGGSLFSDGTYENMLVQELDKRGQIRFAKLEVVADAGRVAAEVLAKQLLSSDSASTGEQSRKS